MDNLIYNTSKEMLINSSKEAKVLYKGDKPAIRECINNNTDSIIRELSDSLMKEDISQKAFDLYSNWLENLACKLHPK